MNSRYSEKELYAKAGDVLDWMYQAADSENIVNSICNSYQALCAMPDARRLGILARKLTEGDKDRIFFEFLCYAAFNAYVVAPAFVVKQPGPNVGDDAEPDVPACHTFVDCLAEHLADLATKHGWSNLRELEAWLSPNEIGRGDVKAVLGNPLNPVDRLNEYSAAEADEGGGSAVRFTKRMAKSLDAAHYPFLEMLVAELDLVMIAFHLGRLAMERCFGLASSADDTSAGEGDAGDSMIENLRALYSQTSEHVLGVPPEEAEQMARDLLDVAKKLGVEQGTAQLPANYGDILLERERQGEQVVAIEKARRDGATDDDIREWWNLHDLQRRMVQLSEETIRYANFLSFQKQCFSPDEAMYQVRRMFPMYGDPDETQHVCGDDRPLPHEIRGRVDRYRERYGAKAISLRMANYRTYNALVRDEIRKGRL